MLAFYMIILLTSWNPEKGKGYLNEVFSYYIDFVFLFYNLTCVLIKKVFYETLCFLFCCKCRLIVDMHY